MSSDDEMDIDGGPRDTEIRFSSSTAAEKGKRSAANLPVEAQDSLPWVEKYRPSTLAEVAGHADILATIDRFVEANRLPHLLLYGPPGTGKTSTVLALARKIYGKANMRQMVLELNASDDRGIDVVREQIKTFSSTKQIFNTFTSGAGRSGVRGSSGGKAEDESESGVASSLQRFKLIILDEADAMTSTAQMALRRIMEKYTPNTRFCIIANYTHKLSPALLSRCTRFRFSPLPEEAIRSLVDRVIVEENVNIIPEAVNALVRLSKGDMRRALNVLQACHASTKPVEGLSYPTPSASSSMPNATAAATAAPPVEEEEEEEEEDDDDDDDDGEGEAITPTHVYTCIASPHPDDIALIRDTLLSTSDVTACLHTINTLKVGKGLALADILTSLSEELVEFEVPAQTRVQWIEGLAEIEYRLAGGGSENLQLGGLVGVVRTGVELMSVQ